jgi:hypothetical protein
MALSRREALMQQGMQNIFGGIQTMDAAKKAEEENRRRYALQGLEYATGLQKEGFDVSPEAQMQISSAFGTGDVGGLASLRSQLPLTDVESKKRTRTAEKENLETQKALMDINKTSQEANKLAKEAATLGDDKIQERLDKSRQQVLSNPATHEMREASTALAKVEAAMNNKDPKAQSASDLSLLYNYFKSVNPRMQAKEGELVGAQDAISLGVDGKLIQMYNEWGKGSFLTPEQRAGFYKASQDAYNQHYDSYKTVMSPVRKSLESGNLPIDQVIPEFQSPKAQIQAQIIQPPRSMSPDKAARLIELQKKAQGRVM